MPGTASSRGTSRASTSCRRRPTRSRTSTRSAAARAAGTNRGDPDNPLFQINNWIEKVPRDPELQGEINARGRAAASEPRLCARERGLKPNIIAVDYYNEGDVLGVANMLNGIAADAEPEVRTTRVSRGSRSRRSSRSSRARAKKMPIGDGMGLRAEVRRLPRARLQRATASRTCSRAGGKPLGRATSPSSTSRPATT